MKIQEKSIQRIHQGDYPLFISRRGKLLWRSNKYDAGSHCDFLEGADGRFWGYSNDPKITKIEYTDVQNGRIIIEKEIIT